MKIQILHLYTYLALIVFLFNGTNENCYCQLTNDNAEEESKSFQKLLDSNQYDELLKIAESIALTAEKNDIRLSLSSYYAGVAAFKKRKFKDSIKFLQNYRSSETVSLFDEMAEFYWAANLIQLDYKVPALRALDKFIKKYENSYFYPDVIYNKASVLFSLSKFEESIKYLQKLDSYQLEPDLKIRIHLLKGKSLINLSRFAESEAEFLNAKISTQKLDEFHLDEASSYLVKLSGLQYRWDDSLSYYKEFKQGFAAAIHALNAAAFVMVSMEQMDRIDEGIEEFEGILITLDLPFLSDLCSEAISIYVEFLIKKYGHKESVSRVKNLMSDSIANDSLIEVLAMIGLEVIEQSSFKEPEEIEVYYKNIIDQFRINDLSNKTLLKIAEYFSAMNYEISQTYYNEVLKRGDYEFTSTALLGLFKLYDAYEEIELIDSVRMRLNSSVKINGMSFSSNLASQDRHIIHSIIGSDLPSDDKVFIEELDKLVSPKRSAIRKISRVN